MNKDTLGSTALLVLRLMVGVIFIAHGAQKLFGVFGGSGMEGFTAAIRSLGFAPFAFWAWVAASAEFGGGVFLILGIFPRVSASLIAVVMLVAILKVHGGAGFFAQQGGVEYQLLLLAVSVALMLAGGGRFSLHDTY